MTFGSTAQFNQGLNMKKAIYFPSSGLSTAGTPAYAIYQEAGSWTYPYPDLHIAMHTGIKLGAHANYNGIRFFNDYNWGSQIMSVNNGADPLGAGNVYVNSSLQAGSSLRAPIFYDSDNTAYYGNFAGMSQLSEITTSNVYNSGWFRNSVNNVGLYNSSSGNHFSANGGYWDVGYGGTNGIRLRNGHNGTVLGYLYAETSGQFGLLDKDGQWTLRTDGTSETELRANNVVGFKINSSGQMFLPHYTTTNTSTTPNSGVNPVQNFNPAGGVMSDTTTDLGAMANGNVVATTQEATFSFTRAQIDALPTSTNSGVTLLNAPGANKFIIVEKATFLLNYNYNGGMMSTNQKYEVQQDGSQSDTIAVLPGTRVNDITVQSGASSFNYGIFEHDSGYATLNRTYQPNKAVTFRRTSGSSALASSVAQIRIKLRYRVWEAGTF